MEISLFWFRRDLRLEDNTGLNKALESGLPVLPVFIFDPNIVDELPNDDARVQFIHELLKGINSQLLDKHDSSITILLAKPMEAFQKLIDEYDVKKVYSNKDYEPYAIKRDAAIKE